MLVACLTMLFSLLLGAPAGYALARYTFAGQNAFRMLVLLTRAFPLAILALPLTVTFIRIGALRYGRRRRADPYRTGAALCGAGFVEPLHGHSA